MEDPKKTEEAPVEVPKKEKKPTKAELTAAEAEAFEGKDTDFFKVQDEETKKWAYPGPLPVLSRAAAVSLGFKRFYTGVPCKNNHDCPRKVKGGCVECGHERLKAYRTTKAAEAKAEKEATKTEKKEEK